MDEPLIRYKNVNINQQELGVLEDVNLELNKGEFVYLIGKVGSGKTSLLKTIYGELDIQSGDAEVLGYNMSNIKRFAANWKLRSSNGRPLKPCGRVCSFIIKANNGSPSTTAI